jgi:hypothetical protein
VSREEEAGALESVELAFFAAGFGDAVGVEGEAIAFAEGEVLIEEFGFGDDSERERFVEREFAVVEEGRDGGRR